MSWRSASNLAWLRGLSGMKEKEPLATRTSFGIGGPADCFLELGRVEAIEKVLAGCVERGIPYLLLGAGTNLLIADAGIDGLVVRVVTRDHSVEGTRVTASAGLKMMRLARIAADAGLRGFEFAIGVPGTVGRVSERRVRGKGAERGPGRGVRLHAGRRPPDVAPVRPEARLSLLCDA
jgi:UDP-N-acetylmuramate dehydrogenase